MGNKLCFALRYKEISEITGTPISTLKAMYAQALRKIKETNYSK